MRWQQQSERVLVREIGKRGGLLPMQVASPLLADHLGISREFASDLVRTLVRTERLAAHQSYLSINNHIRCQCGARMFPAALARTAGVCPRCSRMMTT